jgi:hypothetical protein
MFSICKPCNQIFIFINKIYNIINNSEINSKLKKISDKILKDFRSMTITFCIYNMKFCLKIAPLLATIPEGLPENLIKILSICLNNEEIAVKYINKCIDIINLHKNDINNLWYVLRCNDDFIYLYKEIYERLTGINYINNKASCITFYKSCGIFNYGEELADDNYIIDYYEDDYDSDEDEDDKYLYESCGFIPFLNPSIEANQSDIRLVYDSLINTNYDIEKNDYRYNKLENLQDEMFTILPIKLPKILVKNNILLHHVKNLNFLHPLKKFI